MKLCRFHSPSPGQTLSEYGVIEGDRIRQILTPFAAEPAFTGQSHALDQVKLLSPSEPSKIICVGLNYRSHGEDGYTLPAEPLIFLKPPTAATGPDTQIPFPTQSRQVDFEGELGLVIGKAGFQIPLASAQQHILGYCCANDVTARDIQEQEQSFGRAKSFCGFAPFGPWIETEFDPANFQLRTFLNGALKQSAQADDLLFSIPQLVSFISQVMPLAPGDLILTGTPRGMGPMQPGDRVTVEISGIGRLHNRLGHANRAAVKQETLHAFTE